MKNETQMKKTSFLENIREKKADLSQSRISDTCIITGSTFLQQYYTSLLSLFLQYLQGAPTKMGQEKLHNK